MWINHSKYPPRTPEMLLLNLLAVTLGNFLHCCLKETAHGQVAIVVTAILNKFQPWTQAIIATEAKDSSSPLFPTWFSHPQMLLQGQSRHHFLATLETVIQRLFEVPTYTSAFGNSKTTLLYYRMLNDIKNACHMLSATPNIKFLVPTDTKTRRDLMRYNTTLQLEDLEVRLHMGVAADQEMIMCNRTGSTQEGREGMRRFGLIAAAYLKESIPAEMKPSLDLMIWVALQATGAWQEIRYEWVPIYIAQAGKRPILSSPTRFTSARQLRMWAVRNGYGDTLSSIRQLIKRPRVDLEAAARAAVGVPPRVEAAAGAAGELPPKGECADERQPELRQIGEQRGEIAAGEPQLGTASREQYRRPPPNVIYSPRQEAFPIGRRLAALPPPRQMFDGPTPGGGQQGLGLPLRRKEPHPEGQLRLLAGAAASIRQVRLEPREDPVNLSTGGREQQSEGTVGGNEQQREHEAGDYSQDQPLDLSLESGLRRRAL